VTLRPLLFLVQYLPSRGVAAKAIDLGLELYANNLTDLRDRLDEELAPFGYTATLVGIRPDREMPTT